ISLIKVTSKRRNAFPHGNGEGIAMEERMRRQAAAPYRIFEYVAPSAESQRDSATKPRVARNELPWENARDIGDNPERVVADDHGNKTMPQPLWGCKTSVTFPRVARSSQPWAWLRNLLGIEDTPKEQRLAGAFAPPPRVAVRP